MIAKRGTDSRFARLFQPMFSGQFSGRHAVRTLVIYEPRRIAYSQVYPFLTNARAFAADADVEFRLITVEQALAGIDAIYADATHVILQTWLLDDEAPILRIRDHIAQRFKTPPRLVYIDSASNCDVRFARFLPEFDLYYKKSLMTPLDGFLEPHRGHGNLPDFYGPLFGYDLEMTDWQVPPEYLPRLRMSPNFLTAPGLADGFLGTAPPPQGSGRDIDLHARLGGTGDENWYGAMRRDAQARVERLTHVRCASTGPGVPHKVFLNELRQSKVCFSPFGYGELCWRDIEAFMTGAVLIKPDMSHLVTEPDLYRDDETYVSIRWDFADFEDKLMALLADEDRRARLAQTAWDACRTYLRTAGPVRSYRDIFHS